MIKENTPLIDPTDNVQKLVDASIKRLDDIAFIRAYYEERISNLREKYQISLTKAEEKRIDANRFADLAAAKLAEERARTEATILANEVKSSHEQVLKRVSALELGSSQVSGGKTGAREVWGYILAGIMTLIALTSFILPRLK